MMWAILFCSSPEPIIPVEPAYLTLWIAEPGVGQSLA